MRGINYIQVPTTLLAQIDSSVGGKTGIDLPEGKNLVGAFNPPSEVQIDTQLLNTLPNRQFRSGLAEIIKTGLIQSEPLTIRLSNESLKQMDQRLNQIVKECVEIKARIVQEDEFETKGLRAQLNFGHTVGHAIEQITGYKKYSHGEAIAIGMVVESKLGEKIGFSDKDLTEFVEKLMRQHGLPTKAVELIQTDSLISAMRKDKKSTDGDLSMSLLRRVGECELVANIDPMVVTEVLNEFGKI
jgi:3-dehydroquinate synthase